VESASGRGGPARCCPPSVLWVGGLPCYPCLMEEARGLPHRYPFRFLEASPGEVEIRFLSTAGAGASRGEPLPPWVLLEAMTQGVGLLLGRGDPPGGFVVQIRRYRAPRPVRPGDTLRIEAELVKRMGPVFQGRVRAMNEGKLSATGFFTVREGRL